MDLTGTSVGEADIRGLEKALHIYYEVYIFLVYIYTRLVKAVQMQSRNQRDPSHPHTHGHWRLHTHMVDIRGYSRT